MKFPNSFASSNRSDASVEEFLISHDETNDEHIRNVSTNNGTHSGNSNDSNGNRSANVKLPEKRHISRRWCYIAPNEENKDNSYHRVILEAPFVRMKEIHIPPPRLPIREDSKKIRLAETKKEEGNKLYRQGRYNEALVKYAGAIELCPNVASYYGNRAACLIMVGKYNQALEDSQNAIKLDSSFVKGYLREAKCFQMLGDISAAKRSLDNVKKLDPNNPSILLEIKNLDVLNKYIEDAEKYANKKDFRSALFNIERAIDKADCVRFKLMRAEYLALLGRYQESQEIANDILRFESLNVDALYVRGLSLYYNDNVDKALAHFQQVLRLCPDHSWAKDIYRKAKALMSKKQEGNDAYNNNKIQEAYDIYTQALEIDPLNLMTNAKLYFNRALVNAKRKKLKEASDDCTKAIEIDSNYVKAYLKRAKIYSDMEMYEEAVRDYETIYRKDKSKEHKQLLENAKLELKKSKRKDYYKILGISRDAGEEEIKKAYKKRAMIHHPDRHSSATESERKDQEKKFKEIGEAYAVLSDPKKRSRYDNGVDLEGNGFDGFGDIDPNNIFQTFFSHGGPQFHTFTFGGPSSQSTGPNGFSFNNFPF